MDKKQIKKKSSAGFTLIELLVVLVILGVLGTVAVQQFSGEEDKAKQKATRVSFIAIENAIERFKLDMGRYPADEEGLVVLVEPPQDDEGNWGGKYLAKRKHLKDSWGNDFIFSAPGRDDEPFEIISLGADAEEGGEKFNTDLSNLDE